MDGARPYVRKVVGGVASTAFILAVTALLVEGAYRYHLSRRVVTELAAWNSRYKPPGQPTDRFYGVAPWYFDRDIGYSYTNGPWRFAAIKDGSFTGCDYFHAGNRLGNYGWMPDNYASADLRLMIVGSSFSMMHDERGRLVDQILTERLTKKLNRSVSILNYSRDGTGILNYFTVASRRYDESKPHAIIVLANTVSFIGRPHWRQVVAEDSGFRRMHLMLDPDVHVPDPQRAVPQPIVINEAVTDEWCQRMEQLRERGQQATAQEDPLLKKMLARYGDLLRENSAPNVAINFWRTDTSFVWKVLRYGDPFTGVALYQQQIYNALTVQRYRGIPEFDTSLKRLKEIGVPIILVHIPQLGDMRGSVSDGWNFAPNHMNPPQAAALANDIEAAVGESFVHLYRYYLPELKIEPLKLVVSENDWHPTKLGVTAMADALERVLTEHPYTAGLLQSKSTSRSDRPHEAR